MKLLVICEYLRKNFFNWGYFLVLINAISIGNHCLAQPKANFSHSIHSLKLSVSTDSLSFPIVQLNSDAQLILQFDEFDNDVRSLAFSFTHCEADWLPSDVIDIDFIDEYNRFYDHDSYHLSFNTTTDYIHYSVTIPTSSLKLSGNYLLHVYSDNGDEIITVPFMIYESCVGINSQVTKIGSRDDARQSVRSSVIHPQIHTNTPSSEFRVAVWQNCRPDSWKLSSEPTFIRQDELVYDNDDVFSFEAGNEFRWADNRDIQYPGINVAHIGFHDPFYHFTLRTDSKPISYFFHEDFNGRQYIEAHDIYRPSFYAADYNFIHFQFQSSYVGEVFVFGEITDFNYSPMTYDEISGTYNTTLFVKQGLHNYQYVCRKKNSDSFVTTPTEGSFPETENDYYIAVYYKSISDKCERLVGFKRHNSKSTTNAFIH